MKTIFRKKTDTASLVLLLLPLILSIIPFLSGWGPEILQSGDNVLLEIATGDIVEGVYTGAYSRFEFHHPGPMYFYMRYPLYALSGNAASSFYVSTALIVGLSLWLSFRIIRKNSAPGNTLIFAFVFSLFMLTLTRTIWLSQWNPFIIILPLCLLVFSAAAYTGKTGNSIFIAVITGSFLAQTHLGMMPAVGLIFLYLLIRTIFKRSLQSKDIIISAVLVYIFWIPVIIDQFSSQGSGNISLISRVLSQYPPVGITRISIAAWLSSIVQIEVAFLGPLIRQHFSSPVVFHMIIVLIRSLLLFYAWILAKKHSKRGFEKRLCELTMLLIFISLFSVFNIRGEIYQYLTLWFSVVSALSWLSILLVFSGIKLPHKKLVIQSVFFGLLLTTTILNIKNIDADDFSTDPLHMHDTTVESLSDKLIADDNQLHSNQILLEITDSVLWPEMVGLACNLGKHGYEVEIQQSYSFMLNRPNPTLQNPHKVLLYLDGNSNVNLELQ